MPDRNVRFPSPGQALRSNRGSSLLTIVTVMMVLTLLGMGAMTLSVNSVVGSKKIDNFERAHYGGESAVSSALETLKKQVAVYYARMAAYRSQPDGLADYTQLYQGFFANIRTASETAFREPELIHYQYGSLSTATRFLPPIPLTPDSARYEIEAVTTEQGVSRTVRGSIVVYRVDLTPTAAPSLPYLGNEAVVAGGTLNTGPSSGYPVYGNVRVGELVTDESKPWLFTAYNEESCVDPTVAEYIDWNLDFGEILAACPCRPAGSPSIAPVPDGAVVDTNYVLSRGGVFADPLNITGQPGASFEVRSVGYPGGVVYSSGNLNIQGGDFSGAGEKYIYCEGDLTVSSVELNNFTVYCGGDLTVSNGSFGAGELYCAGSITMYSAGTINCNLYAGGDVTIYGGSFGQSMYCGGSFMCGGLDISEGVIYAEEGIHLGYDGRSGTIAGVLYTNGDVYYEEGISITGQLVAKNNVTLNGTETIWPSVRYDEELVRRLLDEDRLELVHMVGTDETGGAVVLPSPLAVFGEERFG
jgi:hypothetical protein